MSSKYDLMVSHLMVGNELKIDRRYLNGIRSAFYRALNNAAKAGVLINKTVSVRDNPTDVDQVYIQAKTILPVSFEVQGDSDE